MKIIDFIIFIIILIQKIRDNGLPTESINTVLDILKQASFKSHEFKRLDLIFHSYLQIKEIEIERITNIIKKYNFSRLKHFQIVVSA